MTKKQNKVIIFEKKSFFGKIEIYVCVNDRLGFDEFDSPDGYVSMSLRFIMKYIFLQKHNLWEYFKLQKVSRKK